MTKRNKALPWSFGLMLTVASPLWAAGQAAPTKAVQATAPVNLNAASQAELEALPGVGAATAKKIIAGRPYASVADLAKAGVPKNTIAKITPLVTVGGGSSAAAAQPAAKPAPVAPATTAAPVTRSVPAAAAGAQQPPVKGMVWVNLSTKVFHREGDRYYGNTKNGKFMTEADAMKAGYREAKAPAKPKS